MYTKEQLNKLYERIAAALDIGEALFERTEEEYQTLGRWIDEKTPDYEISIYPQGSFALGTVVRPISGNDEYDLDLVCEFAQQYELEAKDLKVTVMKPLLVQYKRTTTDIEEKRRCWRVEYEHFKGFHLDVVPAIYGTSHIRITDKDERANTYQYLGSNPRGYIEWFRRRMQIRHDALVADYQRKAGVEFSKADIEKIKRQRVKTPLQKAIQLLKRHRDIVFADDEANSKPISMIITTLAAQLYGNEDNIVDALTSFLDGAKSWIEDHKQGDQYWIENPSYAGENFADKWNEHPERAEAFLNWIEEARNSLLVQVTTLETDLDAANYIGMTLGDSVLKGAYKDQDKILHSVEQKAQEVSYALVPQKVKSILVAPHKERAPWMLPKGSRVIISAIATNPDGTQFRYSHDGVPLDKGLLIDFTAIFGGIRKPFTVRWQIVNLGEEARIDHGLRGNFVSSDFGVTGRHEATQYSGSHSIQCFVTKGNQCIAKSDIFIVNIK